MHHALAMPDSQLLCDIFLCDNFCEVVIGPAGSRAMVRVS